MNTIHLSALLVITLSPLSLFASSATDRKIEDAAKASYNYRAVLHDEVRVSSDDGVVTLTGAVQDRDEKDLAADTVENLPGVVSVRNDLTIKPAYPERSDGWMALKIRGQLLVKANVSAVDTTVAVQDGVVTLGGTADNLAQKELTAEYAHEIDGVKSVRNGIVVKNSPVVSETVGEKIDDASITSQVKFALLRDKATSAFATKVTTTDGDIVLTGEASSEAERDLATKLAQDVRGVKSVANRMSIKL